jgi:Cu2+-exporting ATPase
MRLADNTPPLNIRVLKPAKHSYLARLDEGIAQSIDEKAPLEIKTEQLLTYFIPVIIGLAITSGVLIGLFFPAAIAIQCAISVLVSACPCTLGLIIPLAVKTGIHKGAEHGVQFKNSKIVQEAEQIDTVVFDLNGTLTTGVPIVTHYTVLENAGISPAQFLSLCSALEINSSHPVGQTIHAFSRQKGDREIAASSINNSHHSGIIGRINEKNYAIGSRSLMSEMGISTSAIDEHLALAAGDSLIFLAEEQQLMGYFIISDPLRKDALHTVTTLTTLGKELVLLTGADEETALRYAQHLGIKRVYANAVATSLEQSDRSKPAYIKWLKSLGKKVAMVGDSANDAQAIAASDLGIAILSQNSDELTQQHAGVIIQKDALLPIISTFAISQQTVANIKQNLLFSLSYNLAAVLIAGGLLVAIGFTLNPAVGVALMVLQASLILLNVYRFKKQSLDHLTEETTDIAELSLSHQVINKHTPLLKARPCCESANEETSQNSKRVTPSSNSFWSFFLTPDHNAHSPERKEHHENDHLGVLLP